MKKDAFDSGLGSLEDTPDAGEKVLAGEDDVIVVVGLPVVT